MSFSRTVSFFSLSALTFVLAAGPASGQTDDKLSAREIFYSPPVEPAQKETAPRARKVKKAKPAESAEARPGSPSSAPVSASPAGAEGAQMLPVSYSPEESVPLGLRYSILKREESGSVEVDPDTVFRSGDRIRLRIDVNTSGYLYVINRGSSGNWNPLFPSAAIAGGDNRVRKGTPYEIPPGYVFTFDEQPGTEKLFIVFSRRPASDLEDLIYSLSGGEKSKKPSRTDGSKILMAQVTIHDGLIDRLRNVYARDLIIEKVDETKTPPPSAPSKEKAVYVVNPSRSADSRLVADITLIHE